MTRRRRSSGERRAAAGLGLRKAMLHYGKYRPSPKAGERWSTAFAIRKREKTHICQKRADMVNEVVREKTSDWLPIARLGSVCPLLLVSGDRFLGTTAHLVFATITDINATVHHTSVLLVFLLHSVFQTAGQLHYCSYSPVKEPKMRPCPTITETLPKMRASEQRHPETLNF